MSQLPLPVTAGRRRHYPLSNRVLHYTDDASPSLWSWVFKRNRTLGLVVSVIFLCSLYLNLVHYLDSKPSSSDIQISKSDLEGSCTSDSSGSSQGTSLTYVSAGKKLGEMEFRDNAAPSLTASHLNHLVMVPGHAIWLGSNPMDAETNDDDWILQPIQRGGTIRAFVDHIKRGISEAVNDPEALLIYSGGQTRPNTVFTESSSYARLAQMGRMYEELGYPSNEFPRVTTEEFALDSYENLIFSVARFKEFTGNYPTKITVVGFDIKEPRFVELHRQALVWKGPFEYIGLHNSLQDPSGIEGERIHGYDLYKNDLYGCHGELIEKRRSRNLYRRFHGYDLSCPEMQGLLDYCPSDLTSIYPGDLPWSTSPRELDQ